MVDFKLSGLLGVWVWKVGRLCLVECGERGLKVFGEGAVSFSDIRVLVRSRLIAGGGKDPLIL